MSVSSTQPPSTRDLKQRSSSATSTPSTWPPWVGVGRLPCRLGMAKRLQRQSVSSGASVACFHCLVCWLVGCALKSYRQAAKQFLKDLQGVVGVNGEREEGWRGGIRWGPLLSWAFLNGNSFQMTRGYLEPLMTQEEYKQVGDDAMAGIRMTLHQLGIRPRTRSLATPHAHSNSNSQTTCHCDNAPTRVSGAFRPPRT